MSQMLQMAQVFVSKSGSNIGCHVAQIFIDIHTCEKSKKYSLNNGKNSSTIDINPVMDKTENSNLSSDSSKERSVGPKEIAVRPERFYINAKSLLDYLSKIIGVDRQSESLRYYGELLPDGKTLYVDLTQYEVIPYGG